MKTCSFFGHRDTLQTEELKDNVSETVERLIVKEGFDTFLFGSRSQFDELCHIVVTELKEKYPNIQRIAYLCKHETACFVGESMKMKQHIKKLTGRDVYVPEYEDIKKSDQVNSAGRASYVERNYWMVDNSEIIVIHFNKSQSITNGSGTSIAYIYAIKKEKRIIEIKTMERRKDSAYKEL